MYIRNDKNLKQSIINISCYVWIDQSDCLSGQKSLIHVDTFYYYMYKYVCTCTYVCISTCINVLTFHFDQSDCLIYVVLDTYMHI